MTEQEGFLEFLLNFIDNGKNGKISICVRITCNNCLDFKNKDISIVFYAILGMDRLLLCSEHGYLERRCI